MKWFLAGLISMCLLMSGCGQGEDASQGVQQKAKKKGMVGGVSKFGKGLGEAPQGAPDGAAPEGAPQQ